jgi:hypothetical protein
MELCLPLTYIIHSFLKRTIMKKIFTLLFAVGMFAAAQAQPGNRDNRQNDQRDFDKDIEVTLNHNPYDNNDDHYGNSRFSNERRMKMQIAQINREYDYKMQRVRNNYFMNRWEKQRLIRSLDDQRQREIRIVYAKFKNKNGYSDCDFPNNRHY